MSCDEDMSDSESSNHSNEVVDYNFDFDDVDYENVSLRDLSLKSVSRNLARYNAAFSTTEDPYFRRNLLFLQRHHSSYLISNQLVNGYLDETYWQFLINEYVTKLNVGILGKECNWNAAFARITEVGHVFEEIDFRFPSYPSLNRVIDFVNAVVSKMPNVEVLDFDTYCNNRTLEILSTSCLNLKELDLDGSAVTSDGLKYLCQRKNDGFETKGLKLKEISLFGVYDVIDDGVIYLLQNMPSLEHIFVTGIENILYRMHENGPSKSSIRMYNLVSLDFTDGALSGERDPNDPTVTDILSVFTRVCPRIKNIYLFLATREHLELVSKFAQLEQLSICELCPRNEPFFKSFLKCKGGTLLSLNVAYLGLSVDILMQSCPRLEELYLRSILFESLKSSVKPLIHLRRLGLVGLNFVSNNYAPQSLNILLSFSPNLKELLLERCYLDDCSETLSNILKFCESTSSLTHVTLGKCDVKESFLKALLLTNSCLEILDVYGCKHVSFSQIANLREMSRSLKLGVKITASEF